MDMASFFCIRPAAPAATAVAGLLSLVFMTACATAPKAQFGQDTTLREALVQVDSAIHESLGKQMDVVAPNPMRTAMSYRNEAREELGEGDNPDDVWDNLRLAKGALLQAEKLYKERRARVPEVLEARAAAINSGARRYSSTSAELDALDDSFQAVADELDDSQLTEARWSRLATRYEALRIVSLQARYLGEAQELVDQAREAGAGVLAPRTLDETDEAMTRAERAILRAPDDTQSFAPEVLEAYSAARMLSAVTATAREASGASNEAVARAIVERDQRLNEMEGELAAAEAELLLRSPDFIETQGITKDDLDDLDNNSEELEDVVQQAREKFAHESAEVFRQGDRLLIRLKELQFPEDTKVLSKVSDVVEELNASKVVVHGSQASQVADYLGR
ncbi:MAG: hypothetical protein AB7P49_18185, partial [Bdellovibrionales bacterium]